MGLSSSQPVCIWLVVRVQCLFTGDASDCEQFRLACSLDWKVPDLRLAVSKARWDAEENNNYKQDASREVKRQAGLIVLEGEPARAASLQLFHGGAWTGTRFAEDSGNFSKLDNLTKSLRALGLQDGDCLLVKLPE